MNRLLIDIGNTRLKWAQAEGGLLSQSVAIEHFANPAFALAQIPEFAVREAQSIWMANVTGALHAAQVRKFADEHWGMALSEAHVIQGIAGLHIVYANPQRLGVDRWLMMLALWREHAGAFIVASAGTALTVDAVNANGQHLGGVISPGLQALQQTVIGTTRFAAAAPEPIFEDGLGTDTEACVRQGALHSAAGLLERLATRYGGSSKQTLQNIILTGGDAALLSAHLRDKWMLRPNLVMEGLLALASLSS